MSRLLFFNRNVLKLVNLVTGLFVRMSLDQRFYSFLHRSSTHAQDFHAHFFNKLQGTDFTDGRICIPPREELAGTRGLEADLGVFPLWVLTSACVEYGVFASLHMS
ncbi:hypothetical protein I7I48_08648 [Histoplasma ohiense]|nr:hypothetical protein I7I48_08648 [Histoplasma ohiense (nom. inval.)]